MWAVGMTRLSITGYHGTRASALPSIRRQGVQASHNPDDWLGAGLYFFVEGLDDPKVSALEWARCKLWDKRRRRFVVDDVAVVEARITLEADLLWDLRDPDSARQFHKRRRQWLTSNVPRRATHLGRPSEASYDTNLMDVFRKDNGIAAVISDFYIQLFIRERHFRLDSRIPNVSVLCLSFPPVGTTTLEIIDAEVAEPSSFLESGPR
jgi:hypothetical protein